MEQQQTVLKKNVISVPYMGSGRRIYYTVETIDLSMTPYNFINVYTVFIDDPELQPILGEHFTVLQNYDINVLPLYNLISSGSNEEKNLKKEIAQQIMNNPTE